MEIGLYASPVSRHNTASIFVPVMEDPSPHGKGVLNVKLSRHLSPRMIPFVLLATTLGMFLHTDSAFAESRGGGVVGINMKYLVDNHTRFQGDLDRLRAELRTMTDALTAEKTQIEQDLASLRGGDLAAGSQPFHDREEAIARNQAEWQIKAQRQRRAIQTREAKLLQNVYLEIKTEVGQYAAQHNVAVVVQFIPADTGTQQGRGGIQANLVHPIVHVNQHYDITGDVLRAINNLDRISSN